MEQTRRRVPEAICGGGVVTVVGVGEEEADDASFGGGSSNRGGGIIPFRFCLRDCGGGGNEGVFVDSEVVEVVVEGVAEGSCSGVEFGDNFLVLLPCVILDKGVELCFGLSLNCLSDTTQFFEFLKIFPDDSSLKCTKSAPFFGEYS
jgi:hypothetical protein